MRLLYLIGFLLAFQYSHAQTDSTKSKNAFSIYGGAGIGGNGIKQGFAKGVALRFHSRLHTIDAFISRATEYEADYVATHNLTLTYDAFNAGISYGCGIYNSDTYAAATVGVGHTNTDMIVPNTDPAIAATFVRKKYIRTCASLGGQVGVKIGLVWFSIKGYYNIFDGPSNYVVLGGLEVTLQQLNGKNSL